MTLEMEMQDRERREHEKGKAEGLREGEQKAKVELIRNMRTEGLDDALIAKVMKLSEKEVAEIA